MAFNYYLQLGILNASRLTVYWIIQCTRSVIKQSTNCITKNSTKCGIIKIWEIRAEKLPIIYYYWSYECHGKNIYEMYYLCSSLIVKSVSIGSKELINQIQKYSSIILSWDTSCYIHYMKVSISTRKVL